MQAMFNNAEHVTNPLHYKAEHAKIASDYI